MVVFEGGRPKTAHYRRFKIKTVSGMDDYAMLKEVLKRRFKRGEQVETPWGIIPDLILIDGGKGQLNAGLEAMRELAIEPIPIASIAKEREEIYVPDTPHPISLPPGSALYLLQRIRDEAHRFALSYHLKVRRKSTFISALDTIPGIGAKRKRALLRKFGSIERIKEATIEDLASTPGITSALAHRLKKQL
jgi:excinuclease ABC subunit C